MARRGALKSKPVELWHEGLTAGSLQVTENDLWIAATAITHDLMLLTADGDQDRMREADPRLKLLLF
jgi:predicted nucleic acid-binding protein